MAEKIEITLSVNGVDHTRSVEPRLHLIDFIRDELGLKTARSGCDGQILCGTAQAREQMMVVWVDDRSTP